MLCKNCGKQNENTPYCIYCGAEMTQEQEADEIAAQTAMDVQSAMDVQPIAVYSQPEVTVPKKRKLWLVIGIIAAVVIGVAAVLFFTLTYPVQGQWYNEDRGEILVFENDGTMNMISLAGIQEQSFSYNRLKGEGNFIIDAVSYAFKADDQQITILDLGTYFKADDQFDQGLFIDQFGKLGTWHSEDRGEVLVFNPEGALERIRLSGTQDSNYQFDYTAGSGQLTLGEASYGLSIKSGQLEIAGIGVYTKADSGFNSDGFIKEHGKLGTWYCEDRGEVLVFNTDGTMQSQHSTGVNDATFEYDQEKNTIELTIEPFSYTGQIENGQLVVDDMGTFVQAEDDFDTNAFYSEFGDSLLGIWFDPEGRLMIDLHDNGTYDAISYGVSFEGLYEQQETGAAIDFVFIAINVTGNYAVIDGEFVKTDLNKNIIPKKMVRDYQEQLGEENRFDDILGTWISDSGAVEVVFTDDGNVVVDVGYEIRGTYEYNSMGQVGIGHFPGEDLVFLGGDDLLYMADVFFTRVN